jgi:hypothetical protein
MSIVSVGLEKQEGFSPSRHFGPSNQSSEEDRICVVSMNGEKVQTLVFSDPSSARRVGEMLILLAKEMGG